MRARCVPMQSSRMPQTSSGTHGGLLMGQPNQKVETVLEVDFAQPLKTRVMDWLRGVRSKPRVIAGIVVGLVVVLLGAGVAIFGMPESELFDEVAEALGARPTL